jgi:chromosomal replication initiator protein
VNANAKQIWQTTIERLQSKVQAAAFTTWFQGTDAVSFQDGIFIVRVPTTFQKAHLEGRFLDLIRSILTEVAGRQVDIRFVVSKETPEKRAGGTGEAAQPQHKRTYRLPKNRLASLEEEKSKFDATFAASTSAAATSPHPVAHRRSVQETGQAFEADH